MKRIALILVLVCSACATTARQRRTRVNQTIAASVVAVGVVAGVMVIYGLVDCADRHGGSCQLPAEGQDPMSGGGAPRLP